MSGSEPQESSTPTLCVGGVTLAAAVAGAVLGGLAGAGLAAFATLLTVGGGYSALAWIFGWPGLRWDLLGDLVP